MFLCGSWCNLWAQGVGDGLTGFGGQGFEGLDDCRQIGGNCARLCVNCAGFCAALVETPRISRVFEGCSNPVLSAESETPFVSAF